MPTFQVIDWARGQCRKGAANVAIPPMPQIETLLIHVRIRSTGMLLRTEYTTRNRMALGFLVRVGNLTSTGYLHMSLLSVVA
jgi:hypothetical protein